MDARRLLIPGAALIAILAFDASPPTAQVDVRNIPLVSYELTADLNKDGITDLISTDFNGDSVAVRLGKGDGTFRKAVYYGAGGGPVSAAVADFDSDGVPDIAVAGYFGGEISVYLGVGDGSLKPRKGYGRGGGATSVAAADINQDGAVDLVYVSVDSGVSVLLNDGHGTFSSGQTMHAALLPGTVAVGEFNNDGIPDVVVTEYEDNAIDILLGDGIGGFRKVAEYHGFMGPREAVAADIDLDGRQDLVIANWLGNGVTVVRGNGNGTFMPGVWYNTGLTPSSVAVADIDKDGLPDILATCSGANNVVALFRGADGGFQPARELGGWEVPHCMAVADLDKDGWLDIMVAYGDSAEPAIIKGNYRNDLDVHVQPEGGGTVSPVRGSYTPDTVIDLHASPGPGYRFSSWKGSVDEPLAEDTTMRIYSPEKVTAVFVPE